MGRLDGKVAAVTGGGLGGSARRRSGVSLPRARAWHSAIGTASAARAWRPSSRPPAPRSPSRRLTLVTEGRMPRLRQRRRAEVRAPRYLINNAGIRKYEKVDEASAASWNEILNVNLMGYVFCAKAAVPLMRRNKGGAIVNVASVRSVVAGGGNLSVRHPPRPPSRA